MPRHRRRAAGRAKAKRRKAEEGEIPQRRSVATSHQVPASPTMWQLPRSWTEECHRRHISAAQSSGRRRLPSSRAAAAMELMAVRVGVQHSPEQGT